MGFFGGSNNAGGHYVGGPNDSDLPMAMSIDSTDVSYTRTTVYAPDGSVKKLYDGSTRKVPQQVVKPAAKPITQTFVTTIPPPSKQNKITRKTKSRAFNSEDDMLQHSFRRAPTIMPSCPSCSKVMVRTKTRTQPSLGTWLAVIALLILFWPICWIPLVCDVFKRTDHYCSHCGVKVAEVKPFQDFFDKRRG
ncbi:hypothetical protein MHU86_7112 [Fragilaria crotonensis]|nr:hypothetical protein MHU86_7112 [Fragilaria crotonensis]